MLLEEFSPEILGEKSGKFKNGCTTTQPVRAGELKGAEPRKGLRADCRVH